MARTQVTTGPEGSGDIASVMYCRLSWGRIALCALLLAGVTTGVVFLYIVDPLLGFTIMLLVLAALLLSPSLWRVMTRAPAVLDEATSVLIRTRDGKRAVLDLHRAVDESTPGERFEFIYFDHVHRRHFVSLRSPTPIPQTLAYNSAQSGAVLRRTLIRWDFGVGASRFHRRRSMPLRALEMRYRSEVQIGFGNDWK